MRQLCVSLVVFGAGIMLYSIYKYYKSLAELKIHMNTKKLFSDWIYAFCFALMSFFFVGYVICMVSYATKSEVSMDNLLVSFIFFFGAIFVFAMIKMTRRMFLMKKEHAELTIASTMDGLTSIPNRRGFDNRIDMEWLRAIRDNTFISILMMDVDKFKIYNDTYGHQQGDVVLQAVAKTMTQSLERPSDFGARWGGEEFIVLLPNTDSGGALTIAERIRLNISNVVIPCADGTETKVTVSIGVNTQKPQSNSSCDIFISEADKALYKAKKSGRNRVCAHDDFFLSLTTAYIGQRRFYPALRSERQFDTVFTE